MKSTTWQKRMKKAKEDFKTFLPWIMDVNRPAIDRSAIDLANQISVFLQVSGSQQETYIRQGYTTVRAIVNGYRVSIDIRPKPIKGDNLTDHHITCHSLEEFFEQYDKLTKL